MSSGIKGKSIESGLVYSVLIGIAVGYFDAETGFLDRGEYIALFAYIPAVAVAFIAGLKLSSWYLPVKEEKPYLELFLVPLLVILFSVVMASLVFSFASMVSAGAGPDFVKQYLASAILPAVIFIIVTWHILLIGGVISSLILGGRNKCF